MNRERAFVAAVQVGAIAFGQNAIFANGRDPFDVVARAGEVPEHALPKEVGKAARDFVRYAVGIGNAPEWYLVWLEELARAGDAREW